MAVARVNKRTGLPYRDVERRTLRQLAEIKISCVWTRRHRGRDARTKRRKITIGRRKAQSALEGLKWNRDLGHELALHSAQIEINVFDLSLRIVLRQQTGAQRTRVVENSPPLVRTDSLIANFQHIARLGLVHGDRSDDRLWPSTWIVYAELCQGVDRHARLHLVEKMRPGVGIADDVARVDGEDGRQRRVKHAEFHRFLGRGHNMFVSLKMGLPPRPDAGLFGARKSGEPRLDGSKSSHEAARYEELSAIAA